MRPMPILIPRHLAEERRQTFLAPILGVYYGLHDVTGRRSAPADLFQALGKYRGSDVIRWIAAVSRWTAEDGPLLPPHQLGMAEGMLPEGFGDSLQDSVRQQGPYPWYEC